MIADVWAEQQAALMPLPVAFDGFVELSKRVSPTCLISFEREEDKEMVEWTVSLTQGYSVPCYGLTRPPWGHGPCAPFANRPVSLRIYPDRLVVAAEGNILCEHAQVILRNHTLPSRTIYDWRHSLAPRHCPWTNGRQWPDAKKARSPSQWRALPGMTACLQTVARSHAAQARRRSCA